MSEEDEVKSTDGAKPNMEIPREARPALETRRDFIGLLFSAASGLALGSVLGPFQTEAQTAPSCGATAGDELLDMLANAITGTGGKVQGMVRMTNENRAVPGSTAGKCTTYMLRYFEGWDATGTKKFWPPANRKGLPTPGPTIVTRIGDDVQIILLNNVNPRDFPGSIDTGHLSNDEPAAGCDVATQAGNPSAPALPVLDTYPNCFHGSNACNLHFHGTHVTPSGFGDNVLVMVQPANIAPNDKDMREAFNEIFANCAKYAYGPVNWKTAVPRDWQNKQDDLLRSYDRNTQFRGQRGLPTEISLYRQNQRALAAGEWPPYHMGAFLNCFKVTPEPLLGGPNRMGQAPGTHWYHAHKHGSTAMHLLHGLAGAMIIRGKYDENLRTVYPALQEKVLVIQEYSDLPSLYRSADKSILLNGQFQPKITMRQGEIQLWRIVNAAQQGQMPITLNTDYRQIAQDGVQFKAENYERQPIGANINMFPGNRMDLLVKAPKPGTVTQLIANATTNPTILATVVVDGTVPEMQFPDAKNYPIEFPNYLGDISKEVIRKYRRLTFGWDTSKGGNPANNGTGRNPTTNAPPHFMIDDKQFDPDVIDHTMELNDYEEWTIENTTSVPHPFHIHVNPFQVIEVLDPSKSPQPQQLPAPWVWWDNFAIPPNGYFKMRTRFADFTGKYVLHCHILGHEDRGMMQAVEVIPQRRLNVPHH
jgi:FtsP/CotA-like multicopper oxidase with cupredoxin domain